MWRRHSRVVSLARRPPAGRVARAPQKRVSHSAPARGRAGLLAISTLVQFRFFRTHTRTAQGIPRTFAVFPSAGDSQKYIHHIHLVCRSCNRPFSPLVAQSDDTAGTRACRSRDFSSSTSVLLATLNCEIRDDDDENYESTGDTASTSKVASRSRSIGGSRDLEQLDRSHAPCSAVSLHKVQGLTSRYARYAAVPRCPDQ